MGTGCPSLIQRLDRHEQDSLSHAEKPWLAVGQALSYG